MTLLLPLAHGIASLQDPPIPQWLAYYGAAAVLVLSFAALGALWRTPILEHERRRPLFRCSRRVRSACSSAPSASACSSSSSWRRSSASVPSGRTSRRRSSWCSSGSASCRSRSCFGNVWAWLNPVARRGRLRRVVLGTGGPRVGAAVHLSGTARSLAGRVPPLLLRRDGARVHRPLRPADARARRRDLQLGHLGRDGRVRTRRLAASRRGVRRLLRPDLPALDLHAARRTACAPLSAAQRRARPRARRERSRSSPSCSARSRSTGSAARATGRTGSSGSTRISPRSPWASSASPSVSRSSRARTSPRSRWRAASAASRLGSSRRSSAA